MKAQEKIKTELEYYREFQGLSKADLEKEGKLIKNISAIVKRDVFFIICLSIGIVPFLIFTLVYGIDVMYAYIISYFIIFPFIYYFYTSRKMKGLIEELNNMRRAYNSVKENTK